MLYGTVLPGFSLLLFFREVLHGVGVKFPIFAVNVGEAEKSEEKGEKCEKKKGENHSDPIYTNPTKNLPLFFLVFPPAHPGPSGHELFPFFMSRNKIL